LEGEPSEENKDPFDDYESELNRRIEEHLKYLSKVYPLDDGPVFRLIASYKKSMEAINHIPMLLTNSLTDLFRIKKDSFASQFQQDLTFLIRSGEIKDLEDREVAVLTQAVRDLMEALFSAIINKTGETLSSYLRWIPKGENGDVVDGTINEVKEFLSKLMYEAAKAKAERDLCWEEARSLKEAMTPQVSGKYRVLQVLEESGRPMRPVEIAAKLGLAEVTVRRYLKDLITEGFLEKVDNRKPYTYRLVDRNWLTRVAGKGKKRKS